jgi:hypothetical protein
MFQKIEHILSESGTLNVKAIYLALEVNTFLGKLYV